GAQTNHDNHAHGLGGQFEHGGGLTHFLNEVDIGHEHSTGNPAQQACTKHDGHGEAINEFKDQRAAPDDDRHAHDQTENDQTHLMGGIRILGGASDGDDVVQAHYEIGDDNGLDCCPYRRTTADLVVCIFFRNEQLDANPQQKNRPDNLQEGNAQQR